jgi:hypothetical protein
MSFYAGDDVQLKDKGNGDKNNCSLFAVLSNARLYLTLSLVTHRFL